MRIKFLMGPILFGALFILLSGCASKKRTEYKAYEKSEGYRDTEKEDKLRVANFRANSYTKKSVAENFAKFRAIEWCLEHNYKIGHIMEIIDKSEIRDVIQTTSSGFPSYYYGMYPYYGRFHSGLSVGFSHGTSQAWEQTYIYPEYDVIYQCTNKAYGPEIVFREVSSEDMKLLIKDLKGGLQIERILDGSVNKIPFSEGDVLVRADGKRIEKISDLLTLFNEKKTSIKIEFIRDGIRKVGILNAVDVTSDVEKSQHEIIRSACGHRELKRKHRLCI